MYIYIYVYIYIFTFIYTYIYMYIYIFTFIYIHIYISICMIICLHWTALRICFDFVCVWQAPCCFRPHQDELSLPQDQQSAGYPLPWPQQIVQNWHPFRDGLEISDEFLVKHHIPHISQDTLSQCGNPTYPSESESIIDSMSFPRPHSNGHIQAAEYWRVSLGLWASNAKPSSPEARLDNAPAQRATTPGWCFQNLPEIPISSGKSLTPPEHTFSRAGLLFQFEKMDNDTDLIFQTNSMDSFCWENRLETPTGKPQNGGFLQFFPTNFLDWWVLKTANRCKCKPFDHSMRVRFWGKNGKTSHLWKPLWSSVKENNVPNLPTCADHEWHVVSDSVCAPESDSL